MKRRFNTTGSCNPERHYMVRLDDRLKRIKERYVDYGSYFVINKGRQYGKTTTLQALAAYLSDTYIVLALDFQLMGTEDFSDEVTFSHAFMKTISKKLEKVEGTAMALQSPATGTSDYGLKNLFIDLNSMCENSPRPVVLIIDEVDSASNNQVFIGFLAQLRGYYLEYLKPVINGTGNYYIEAQTRDARRTDVIVDYRGEQFIVELKIWHGSEYNKRGEKQLTDYLDYYHKDRGYMLSFNFNQKKETGVKEIHIGNRTVVEAVV